MISSELDDRFLYDNSNVIDPSMNSELQIRKRMLSRTSQNW